MSQDFQKIKVIVKVELFETYTELNNTAVVGGNAAFYPRLSILAKKYLAIPVSYVPPERVFSLAGPENQSDSESRIVRLIGNIFLGSRVSEEKNF
jgi:hypothetical protein